MISCITADESFTFKEGDNFTLELSMANANLSHCDLCSCVYNLFYPNGSIFVSEGKGTNTNSYCRYVTSTNISGKYGGEMVFNDTVDYGRTTFEFIVNPSGIEASDQRTNSISRGIYFTLVLAILFFLAFLFSKQKIMIKWTYFTMSFLFFLITLNLLVVGLETEVVDTRLETFFDGFTAIFWYLFWFAAGLMILMWIFTFIQTYFYRKNLRDMQKYGGGFQ